VLGVADLHPARARAAMRGAGWPEEQLDAPDLSAALASGRTHLTDDAMGLIGASGLEVLVEATGDPRAGVRHALAAIEHDANERVAAAEKIEWRFVPLAEARAAGAMMLFGEKYPDPARMVSMGSFSRELCGGTHLDDTAEVQALEIIAEEAVAAGTRRIVALQSLQRSIQVELHEAMVGTSQDVLVDAGSRRRDWEISGRTTGNTVVNLPGDRSWIGRVLPVVIKRAGPNSVWGEAIAYPA